MPVPSPSQTEGVRLQTFRTVVTARANLKAGDIAAFASATGNQIDMLEEVVKIDGPKMLMRCVCLMLEDVVAGQKGRALIQGSCPAALLHFKHRIELDDALVVNLQGGLTPHGERGDRVVAFAKCALDKQDPSGRTLGAVMFDGLAGFGPFQ